MNVIKMNQVHLSAFKARKFLCEPLLQLKNACFYNKKVNVMWKRGSMLSNMFVNKDKKKNWHFKIGATPSPQSKNVFEKLHRPSKRQNVLNSLFIENITDVLSTGDVAPEVIGYGVEITGVKISPCFKILNVYWQTSPHYYQSGIDIQKMFDMRASSIRTELVSRNVLGHVPKIFFIRDATNTKSAAFEEAIKQADLGPERDLTVIPDEDFTKNMYSFKPKKVKVKPVHTPEKVNSDPNLPPPKPDDMKSDVFGLNHEVLMNKVLTLKKRSNLGSELLPSAVSEHCSENADLFSKIPGTTFQSDSDRKILLKEFQLQRKMLLKKINHHQMEEHSVTDADLDDCMHPEQYSVEDADNDFIDEETTERF